jgi:hypothetical protein
MTQKASKWSAEAFDSFYNTLSDDERAYFIATTDIFHDKPYNVNGRPSLSNQLQNTVVLNMETTFTRTSFGLTSDIWDLHIASLPFLTRQVFSASNDDGYQVTASSAIPKSLEFGGLVAWPAFSGTSTFLPSSTLGPQFLDLQPTIFPAWNATKSAPLARRYYEVLAIGFEVRDTTPELLRSGSAVLYRLSTQARKSTLNVLDPLGQLNSISPRSEFKFLPMLPSTQSLANQIPSSTILEVKEGSYQMNCIQDSVSDFYCTGNSRFHFTPLTPPVADVGNSWTSSNALSDAYDYVCPDISGDFDVVGWYAAGLNSAASISVRYRVILSLVPSPQDAQLVSLAKVSPDMNTKLDSLISHIQNEFPPGVPVSMNPEGKWFREVMKIGKKVIPKAIPIVQDVMSGNYGSAISETAKLIPELTGVKKKADAAGSRLDNLEARIIRMENTLKGLSGVSNVKRTMKVSASP